MIASNPHCFNDDGSSQQHRRVRVPSTEEAHQRMPARHKSAGRERVPARLLHQFARIFMLATAPNSDSRKVSVIARNTAVVCCFSAANSCRSDECSLTSQNREFPAVSIVMRIDDGMLSPKTRRAFLYW